MHEKDNDPQARITRIHKDDALRQMPECDPVVLRGFFDVGYCRQTDMGGALPVDWLEIRAYANGQLTEWECRQIRMMSEAYCSERNLATRELGEPPPYTAAIEKSLESQRAVVAKSLKDAIRSRRR